MPKSTGLAVFLDEAWWAVEQGNLVKARSLVRRAARRGAPKAEIAHLLGRIEVLSGDEEAALAHYRRAVDIGGPTADLLYDMALSYEDLGRESEKRECFLRVLEMDKAAPRPTPLLSEDEIIAQAQGALESLPDRLREALYNVPLIVEARPATYLVESGFDPRSLGLFEGTPFNDELFDQPQLATRIVLYDANIFAFSRHRVDALEQVRITVLHETAHYFGLDEEAVAARGLA